MEDLRPDQYSVLGMVQKWEARANSDGFFNEVQDYSDNHQFWSDYELIEYLLQGAKEQE